MVDGFPGTDNVAGWKEGESTFKDFFRKLLAGEKSAKHLNMSSTACVSDPFLGSDLDFFLSGFTSKGLSGRSFESSLRWRFCGDDGGCDNLFRSVSKEPSNGDSFWRIGLDKSGFVSGDGTPSRACRR